MIGATLLSLDCGEIQILEKHGDLDHPNTQRHSFLAKRILMLPSYKHLGKISPAEPFKYFHYLTTQHSSEGRSTLWWGKE